MPKLVALAIGTRVEKINSVTGDSHEDGAQAVIIEMLGPTPSGEYGYFVHWDDMPSLPVFIAGSRVRSII